MFEVHDGLRHRELQQSFTADRAGEHQGRTRDPTHLLRHDRTAASPRPRRNAARLLDRQVASQTHQGIVYGAATTEAELHPELATGWTTTMSTGNA